MEEKEEGGISLKDILSTIFSQKWIALIIVFVVTLAGTLGIYFGKNYLGRTYDVSFTLELPQTKEKDEKTTSSSPVVYYPDSTPFSYTDIVSVSTLRKVKKLSETFENIDIEKMSKNGDISISRSTYETANSSGVYESIYNLSVKAKYFPSKDVAHDFVVALTNTPTDYLRLMDIDYNVYINSAKTAPDYVTEVSKLISQNEYLIERYETYNKIYNDLSIDGRTMLSYGEEIKSYGDKLEDLLAEVRTYGYLKSKPDAASYEIDLQKLQRKYDVESAKLESLSKVKWEEEACSSLIAQAKLVAELEAQIKDIDRFKDSENYGDAVAQRFKDDLNKAHEQVQAFTDEYKDVVLKLYGKVSVISYSNSNVIVTSGVTGIITALVLSFVVSVILAMIIAYVVGWSKRRKAASLAQQALPETDNQ